MLGTSGPNVVGNCMNLDLENFVRESATCMQCAMFILHDKKSYDRCNLVDKNAPFIY